MINQDWEGRVRGLLWTAGLGLVFLITQGIEYRLCSLGLGDRVLGRRFYSATGTHGAHVFVGGTMLLVIITRIKQIIIRDTHHFGLTAAI